VHHLVVGHIRERLLALALGQGLQILRLVEDQVYSGQACHKLLLRYGKEAVRVLCSRAAQVAEENVHRGGQVVGGGPDGVFVVQLTQQVKEHTHRVDHQLLGQRGHHRALEHVVRLGGGIEKRVRVQNGGAVPAQGAAQQKVRRYIVKIAGPHHKGQTRLPHAVFIVRQQRLGNAQSRS